MSGRVADLVNAIKIEDVEEIADIVGEGGEFLNENYLGKPPLFYAAETRRADIMKLLLEKGANPYKTNQHDETVLFFSARAGDVDIVKALLDGGAEVDKGRVTSLMAAADKGHIEVVRLLLDRGAEIDKVSTRGGFTPLIYAAHKGHIEVVRLLLDRGAEIDKVSTDRLTPLMSAADKGHIEVIRLLLDRGAEIDKEATGGFTPLAAVAYGGHIEVVRLLLDRGAEIDKVATTSGFTPLIYAALNKHVEVVKLLLEKGAKTDVVFEGKTILQRARDGRFTPEINALIDPPPQYTGISKPDIEKFNIFLAIPDYPADATEEQKKAAEEKAKNTANNTSLCPVCLAYTERSMGCLYMHHKCLPESRHEELYKKYKSTEGDIWWCTDCGRICTGHKHHALGLANGDAPKLLPAPDPFDKTCISNGGGSVAEKLRRISRLIEFYADLQVAIASGESFLDTTTVRKMVIEETWNGAAIRTFVNPQSVKRWKTSLDVFPQQERPSTEVEDIVVPSGSYEAPKKIAGYDDPISLETCDAIQFKHKNKDGVLFSHVTASGEQHFICKESLKIYLATLGENLGKCYDEECGGYLWPSEVRAAFQLFGEITPDEETLLKRYEDRFSRYPYPRAGGMRGGALPSLNTLFSEMTNGKCYLKRGGKRRTYKNQKRSKRLTRTNRR